MRNRIIGGTVFALIVYLTLFLNLFSIMIILFLIVGLTEWTLISKKKEIYSYVYLIIFLVGITSMASLLFFGSIYIFILISFIMLNDVGAYFIGKQFGKHKFSKTSPNKTIEGLLGGIIFSVISFIIYLIIFENTFNLSIFSGLNVLLSVTIIIVILLFSDLGDILESNLKRISEVKDSGTIIYGHGGILDRIDSWIVGAFVFNIVLIFLMNM